MKDMTIQNKDRIRLFVLFLAYVLAQVCISSLDRMHLSMYNGVLMACQFAVCLLMVRVNYRFGAYISYGLIAVSILQMIRVVIFAHNMSPIPGLCNMSIYLVVLVVLSRQFGIREREAVTDYLTGLWNRRGLYRQLAARTESEKPFHVIYIDLGNFKFINDNYGHAYGDDLLKVVTKRMSGVVGRNGVLTRLGGDEFVLVLDGNFDAAETAERVLDAICEKATLKSGETMVDSYLTACAGIASYPKDAKDGEALIKYADIAMFEASRDKTKRICFFNKDMEQYLLRQMELEKLIKEGLEKNYFYLVYQPQYRLEGRKLRGFESLLRLKTADGKVVSPGEFIPVAEKGDLILQIDDYVLRRAMLEYRDIVKEAKDALTISVNVSAKNIGAPGFVDKVYRMLQETGFPANNLEIEITEYCLVQSVEVTIENIQKLRAAGVQVALDDFGTGYTSLSYLAKMPINLLKVDKSLVDDIVTDEKSRDFVTAVISMGHLMGCEVISEGVENEQQLSLLTGQECDFVQGYVWGRPLDYEVAKELSLQQGTAV